MANYATLKAAVADVVKTNGTQAITGANLQAVLLSIINSIGANYTFAGVATPSTSAGTPDENVFYIGGAGTYANFGSSYTVPVGSICVFKYNGSWTKEQIALFAGIDDVPTAGSDNLVKSGGVKKDIDKLDSKIDTNIFERIVPTTPSSFTTGKRLYANNGVIASDSAGANYSATEAYFFAAEGTKIKVTGSASNGYAILCVYDINKSFLSTPLVGTGAANAVSVEYTFAQDGYYRCSYYTSYAAYFSCEILYPITIYDKVESSIYGENAYPFIGSEKDILTSSNFTQRGFAINLSLELFATNSFLMSDPILVKKGQTIKINARGTGTQVYLIVGVDSSTPLTSISDVRKFTRITDNFNGDSATNTFSEYTATEDTYVIAQYYRINNGGYIKLGYTPMNDRASAIDELQRELYQSSKEYYMKDWVKDEVALLLTKLKNISKKRLLVWAVNTDQHYSQNKGQYFNNQCVLRGLYSIPSLADKFPLNLVVLGGDEAGYSLDTTVEAVSADIAEVIDSAYTTKCPVIAIAGNHDAYQNAGTANSDGYQMFNWKTRANVARRELDWAALRSTNCWFDDEINKVRFVFLDSYSVNRGNDLMDCLQSSLNDEKIEGTDWKVIIFSHNVVSAAGDNTGDPMSADVWTYISGRISAGVNVVMCINGHSHKIAQGVKDDVLMICVGQAMFVNTGTTAIHTSFDGNIYYNIPNSAKETSYEVFAWEIDENILHIFQYGAGTDRYFDTTQGSRGIKFDSLSGVVSSQYTIAGGTIKAKNHNTEYSVTLTSDGNYSFPYLCPNLVWTIEVNLTGGQTLTQNYTSMIGSHTLDISI